MVIGLVDCNSFYCSCERLFRPDLRHRPVVVLSNNDGCAIALTPEAKALGLKIGDPYFKIKDHCLFHGVAVFSSNFSIYTNLSNRVMSILSKSAPEVEVYSIDESFLNLSGIDDLLKYGHEIKNKIWQQVGIPVGVGIAPTKVLAKIANRLAKKNPATGGVVNLMEESARDGALAMVEVEDIWGVGRANSIKLRSLGIKNALQFRDYSNDKLILKLFTKIGLQLKQELQGISCFPLVCEQTTKKEIMCSRTFGGTVVDRGVLKESVANYISSAAEKMRRQNSLCSQISVFAFTNRFSDLPQHHMYDRINLSNPTCDTRTLLREGFCLIDKNFLSGFEYRKAGIKLSNFSDSSQLQLDFFNPSQIPAGNELMKVVDRINRLQGEGTIKFAACGTSDEAWKMNRNFKSPRYLTSWNELKIFGK